MRATQGYVPETFIDMKIEDLFFHNPLKTACSAVQESCQKQLGSVI